MIAVSWGETSEEERQIIAAAIEPCPLKRIMLQVCATYGIKYTHLVSKRRQRVIARPRQEAYYRCYNETPASLPEIGRAFGNRDHTTILYGIREHEKRLKVGTGGANIQS